MSALTSLEEAVRTELAKPDTRKAIEGLELVVLEAVKNVLEAAIPPWLRPFVGGLVDSLAEKGIHSLESFTDKALAGLAVGHVQPLKDAQGKVVGSVAMALTVAPEPTLTPSDTVADWPGPRE